MKKIICLFVLANLSYACFAQNLTASQSIPNEVNQSSTFVIEITINKGELSGFIKLAQTLPPGFTAEDIDSKGGSFTFSEDGIKIIWMEPTKDALIKISYKVTVPDQVTENTITGKISYIDGNERKIFDFPAHTLKVLNGAPVKQLAPHNETPAAKVEVLKAEKVEEPVKVEVVKAEKVEEAKKIEVVQKETAQSKAPTAAVAVSDGRTYKVQIGAFSAKPKIDGVSEISTVVLDNGITKYFSGNFTNYEDAVKRKKTVIEKGFSGAFIVSFKDGKIVK